MGDLLRAFLTVFPAELPDKSMVATIILVTRYRRPLAVWLGAALAFAVLWMNAGERKPFLAVRCPSASL